MPSLAPRLLLAASVASSMATATKSSREELSSVFGWISLSSWIIPSSSQLIENYQNKSGEGLSLAFVIIWLLGDLLNLVGAIRQELLFTMTLLAAYYSVCDVILIYQYFYYKKYYVNGIRISSQSQGASETTPLLNGQPAGSEENPNASSISHARSHREEPQDFKRECLKYSFAVLLVSFTGVAAWLISRWRNGDEIPGDQPLPPARPGFRWDAQAAGWASAVLYLASRIPQIFKNRVTKCEGLSLALFVFAVVGNVTYVASILIKSTEHDYVIENLSWLVGSGGTVLLDFVVLFQFISYRM